MAFKGKTETLEQKRAFDFYYGLGAERSLNKVGIEFKKSKTTIWNWASKFNWKERIEQRDIELAKQIEEKTNETILDIKAKYREDIKVNLSILKSSLNDIIQKIKNKKTPLTITDVEDFERIIKTYERLVKLDMLMLGEKTDEIGVNLPKSFAEWIKAFTEKKKD